MGGQQSIMIVSLVLRRIMVVPVLLSMLISLGSAAPIHFAPFTSPSVNVATATANVTVVGSSLRPIGEYLTTLFPPVRRCGGRRGSKCGGGSSSRPPPPPPPGPTQIAQSLLLKNVNTSEYAGLYKVVVEAGWGISIGIYDEANREWRCDFAPRFLGTFTTVPSHYQHLPSAVVWRQRKRPWRKAPRFECPIRRM